MVTAWDGTDEGALERRMAARPSHFELAAPLVAAGTIITAGAILDDDGRMIGSVLIMDFPDRAALDTWLAAEPYVTGDVWRRIDVRPLRLAFQNSR